MIFESDDDDDDYDDDDDDDFNVLRPVRSPNSSGNTLTDPGNSSSFSTFNAEQRHKARSITKSAGGGIGGFTAASVSSPSSFFSCSTGSQTVMSLSWWFAFGFDAKLVLN